MTDREALSAKWRRIADEHQAGGNIHTAYAHRSCADDLDALPSIPDVRAQIEEVIRRARLYKKVGPAGSGIQMHQLTQVEVVFSLDDAAIRRELDTALAGGQK